MKTACLGFLSTCLLLAGCGGTNDGMTTPPPPPPPPASTTPLPLTTTASFETITGALSYNGTLSDGIFGGGNARADVVRIGSRDAALTFAYDVSSGTYTVRDSAGSATLGASDKISATGFNTAYSRTTGTVTDTLTLYGNVRSDTAGTAPVALSYTSYGLWMHADSATPHTATTYFLYGQPTTDMPTTGTATYQMTASANMLQTSFAPATFTRLSGSATLSANFTGGTVETVLSIAGGTFTGTGSIGGNQYSGTFASSVVNFSSGSFQGGFFGPAAKETGYTFQIFKYNPDPYAGAAASAMYTYVSGVAVGPKN